LSAEMPLMDTNQPPPTPAEKAQNQQIYLDNMAQAERDHAAQRAFDDKMIFIIVGTTLLVVVLFGRWFIRLLRELAINSAAKGVRAKRAVSGKVEGLKREIVDRADK
jgi:hypothetical protein